MNWKKILPLIVLAVMAAAVLLIRQSNDKTPEIKPEANVTTDVESVAEPTPDTTTKESVKNTAGGPGAVKKQESFRIRGLNRHPAVINYSKHARCRMDCRHISEREVTQVLQKGKINYKKSELQIKSDCKSKYAVEGYTDDKQHVRIIFAPCSDEVTVVTVIDLDKEWVCNCE